MRQKFKQIVFVLSILCCTLNASGQIVGLDSLNSKNSYSIEIDPIVPIVLKGIGGHIYWQPKKSKRFLFGFAVIALGNMPNFIINSNTNNKDKGWKYKINQGFGIEGEFYYKKANTGFFTGLQLFTQEITLSNTNVPSITNHRTNTGMVVITTGYKWYLSNKQHFYFKPWAGLGYSGIMKGAFSSKIIPNTLVGTYKYDLQKFTPFATIHIGYKF